VGGLGAEGRGEVRPERAVGPPWSDRPRLGCEIWGVLNVTPDSFSDGGRFFSEEAASSRARAMVAEGAAVIDVGGASSRPPGATYGAGAGVVSVEEEIARIAPVIARLSAAGIRVSVDTSRGRVAEQAVRAGASLVNDVTMGCDETLLKVAADHPVDLVLMHARGDGRVDATSTDYGDDVVATVRRELGAAIQRAVAAGVDRDRIWIDPGIGFSKTAAQSAELLARLSELELPHRVLVGASRKSFLATLAPAADGVSPAPTARLGASLIAASLAMRNGAHAVRVHDVAETFQALALETVLGRLGGAHLGARLGASREGAHHG
jgi:dihydropteroate synthase